MNMNDRNASREPGRTDVATNPDKDPDDWVTGDEPMTGAQASYLATLAQEAGATMPERMTKAEASKMIEALQQRTGRGQPKDEGH